MRQNLHEQRLAHVVVGARIDGGAYALLLVRLTDTEHRNVIPTSVTSDGPEEIDCVHIRKLEIDDEHVERRLLQQCQTGLCRGCRYHTQPARFERSDSDRTHELVRIDKEDVGAHSVGWLWSGPLGGDTVTGLFPDSNAPTPEPWICRSAPTGARWTDRSLS